MADSKAPLRTVKRVQFGILSPDEIVSTCLLNFSVKTLIDNASDGEKRNFSHYLLHEVLIRHPLFEYSHAENFLM